MGIYYLIKIYYCLGDPSDQYDQSKITKAFAALDTNPPKESGKKIFFCFSVKTSKGMHFPPKKIMFP